MSDRLTDEELNAIEGQCDGLGLVVLNPAAQRDVRAMIAELRERRTADLTAEEREALEHARDNLSDSDLWQWPGKQEQKERALALLDRLIAQAGGR